MSSRFTHGMRWCLGLVLATVLLLPALRPLLMSGQGDVASWARASVCLNSPLPLPLPDDTPSGLLGGCDLCAIHTEALGLGRLDALPTVSMRWHSPLSVAVPHPTLATANPLGLHFDGRAPPRG